MEFTERIATLEAKGNSHDSQLDAHEALISELDSKMDTLVSEVRQIRNALYFMAVAIAANIPALERLLSPLLKLF